MPAEPRKVLSLRPKASHVQIILYLAAGTETAYCVSLKDKPDRKKANGHWISKKLVQIIEEFPATEGHWHKFKCQIPAHWWKQNRHKLERHK